MRMIIEPASKSAQTAAIVRLAEQAGIVLDDHTMHLLSRYHGQRPERHTIDVGSDQQSAVRQFLSLTSDSVEPVTIAREAGCKELLAFAEDDSGNYFCLSKNGSVWWLDHEIVRSNEDLVFLSRSLAEFLNSANEYLEELTAEQQAQLNAVEVIDIDEDFLAQLKAQQKGD